MQKHHFEDILEISLNRSSSDNHRLYFQLTVFTYCSNHHCSFSFFRRFFERDTCCRKPEVWDMILVYLRHSSIKIFFLSLTSHLQVLLWTLHFIGKESPFEFYFLKKTYSVKLSHLSFRLSECLRCFQANPHHFKYL